MKLYTIAPEQRILLYPKTLPKFPPVIPKILKRAGQSLKRQSVCFHKDAIATIKIGVEHIPLKTDDINS